MLRKVRERMYKGSAYIGVSFLGVISFLLLSFGVFSQAVSTTGGGSMTVDNSTVTVAAGTTEQRFSEGVYFGPQANWTIDGVLEIWSKNIWIAPTAIFKGSGKIVIHNPGSNPYYTAMNHSSTFIDGNNGAFIDLMITHENNRNLVLADIADPGYNTSNPVGKLSASLNIGGQLDLAVDEADVILNGHDLTFGSSGEIQNFSAERMVVTENRTEGHLVKEFPGRTEFVFPVGIAERDYTPAIVRPTAAAKFYVSVQDYFAAGKSPSRPDLGMDRVWHIYSDQAQHADLVLQHQASSNGAAFKGANAQIAKYEGGTNWEFSPATNPAEGMHVSENVQIIAEHNGEGGFFTKISLLSATLNIPSLFTPNGDGVNDYFEIKGLELFPETDLRIVNRWGHEVYKSHNYQNNWEGPGLNEGTYFYELKVRETPNGEWVTYRSYITLIRRFK